MSAAKPRARINPQLIAAIRCSHLTNRELARRAGFPGESDFSLMLCGAVVVPSPRTVLRIQAVADIIRFTGDIFAEAPPLMKRRCYEADSRFASVIEACGVQWRRGHVWPPRLVIELQFTVGGNRIALNSKGLAVVRRFAEEVGYNGPLFVEEEAP